MTDFSDDSDVNPDEMARMVEEFDDLDNTLLGVGAKTNFIPAANGSTETKKKISFKDTIDDDILADLSSDGEDLYTAKKPILPNAKSNLLADLFGVKKSEPQEKVVEPLKKENVTYAPKIDVFKEKSIAEDNTSSISMNKKPLTVTQSVGRSTLQNTKLQPKETAEIVPKMEDPPKLLNSRDKKSSLMEDMFGTRGRSVQSREIDTRSSFSKLGLENPASSVVADPPKFDKTIKSSTGYTLEPSMTREPRRGRRNSPIISDPLGLFAAPAKQIEPTVDIVTKAEDIGPAKSLPLDDLPEWLGGTSKSKENKTENMKQSVGPTSDGPQDIIDSRGKVSDPSGSTGLLPHREIYHPEMSMMIGSQFDQQAALISMQQQEHELRTAANLSHQNEQMTRIVESQKSKLDEQEKMFNVLIKRQFDRQSMLESQMRIQQARIDNYIQTLMTQPTTLPIATNFVNKTIGEDCKNDEKEMTPECMVKRLQLENDYLENTLEKLKEKHHKELEILEESYEKQILFLTQSMEKMDKKIQQDNETLEIEYEKKIEKLKIEKEQLEQNYREDIEELKKNEKIFFEDIHSRHCHNMELLEKEHAETIDGITRAKELERMAVESITTHKTDLGNLVQQSKVVIDSFQNLQKRLEDKDENFGQTRESHLKKQEENLQLLREQLNLQQESVSEERKRLVETCQKLDNATVNLTAEFAKKSSMINDTEERFATRERAIIREKQLFDEQIKWEREHLQLMKENLMKEQERQIKLLSEERETIVAERTKLQVLNRLQSGSDDMAKVELEAALRTAQDAENSANIERRKWQERSNALEMQKRNLCEKERYLVQRAKELENLTQSALATRDEGLRAFNESKRIEKQHKDRLGQLQSQLENLAERENKVATEKLALARERLATRFVLAEKPEKDIEETTEPTNYRNDRSDFISNSIGSTHFKDVVDPHLLLLKLNLDNKLDNTNELLAAMIP